MRETSKVQFGYFYEPPQGAFDSRIHEQYFRFSRTHKEEKNGMFRDSKNGILSIHEPQLTNMQQLTNTHEQLFQFSRSREGYFFFSRITNEIVFTNSRTILRIFTNFR